MESEPEAKVQDPQNQRGLAEIMKKVEESWAGSITHLFNCTTNLGVAVKVLYIHIGILSTGSQLTFCVIMEDVDGISSNQ